MYSRISFVIRFLFSKIALKMQNYSEFLLQNRREKVWGFELITNNSNSNTFDVSLLKYYITNN